MRSTLLVLAALGSLLIVESGVQAQSPYYQPYSYNPGYGSYSNYGYGFQMAPQPSVSAVPYISYGNNRQFTTGVGNNYPIWYNSSGTTSYSYNGGNRYFGTARPFHYQNSPYSR